MQAGKVTVLRAHTGVHAWPGSSVAAVPAAMGLSDGQVTRGLLRISLQSGHEPQGLRLGHLRCMGSRWRSPSEHGEGIRMWVPLQHRPLCQPSLPVSKQTHS